MGIYLNPGFENFKEQSTQDLFVDKTMMLSKIWRIMDSGNKYICMSRPRRFGKTYAGNMLSCYFSKGCDSEELFAPLKISQDPDYKKKLNQYNVIKLDMNSEYQNTLDKKLVVNRINHEVKIEIQQAFPDVDIQDSDSLAQCIQRVFSATGEQFIIIIDEYDVFVREQVQDNLFQEYLGFLNGLFKSDTLRPAIALAYLTGILPVVRDKIQSKLNNFDEYTILDAGELAEYVGFTDEEVHSLCDQHQISYNECRRWYDGYTQNGFELYNPESVVKCIQKKRFGSYWGKTSSYEVITDRIKLNFSGVKDDVIKMLSGESVDVDADMFLNTMVDFKNRDDVFTFLIHLGYLAYDNVNQTCRIPNKEVREEWMRAISRTSEYDMTTQIIQASKQLLTATINGDESAVATALDESHIHVTSNRSYNNEDALQSAIYLSYIYALNKYTVIKEMTTGKGFADVVFIPIVPDMPAIIIELKHNKCTQSGIDQIHDKQYYDALSLYRGDLLFVCINYDEKTKTHTCRIEKFIK